MEKIFSTLAFLIVMVLNNCSQTANKKEFLLNVRENNNFVAYKGQVKIEVNANRGSYKEMEKNVGKTYKAYFDFVSKDSGKIIFYEDENIKLLEVIMEKEKLSVILDEKDVTENLYKYKKEFLKYPYTFMYMIFADIEKDYRDKDSIFDKIYISYLSEMDELAFEITSEEGGYEILSDRCDRAMIFDKNYRITDKYTGAYKCKYEYGKISPVKISMFDSGSIQEDIEVIFLDEKGWVKK